MKNKIRKIRHYLSLVEERARTGKRRISPVYYAPCGYKTGHTPPDFADMELFPENGTWGAEADSHAWFRFSVTAENENTFLCVDPDREGWDAVNPQYILYIDGRLVQGLDKNHTEAPLPTGKTSDVAIYAYTGPDKCGVNFSASTFVLCPEAYELYYDLKYPLDALDFLEPESPEYAGVVDHLWRAVSMLDFYDASEGDFAASARRAHDFMEKEFYGTFCGKRIATTVGIGHTHIDCAWLWTLAQTREKVQRSFSTVLELMRRYPEYKFMSSQALLYKFLKEEAPDLFEEVRERVKEGRWECEGAMWVEADCNLSGGESLVRQVLYGKEFFRDELGVESKVLWLPDVFGYSAALPQILKKSGVDWFVTSKISWNDTDRMPYDTFRWKGIDGTEINTYFLTPQEDKGEKTPAYCTYVGHTDAKMVNGTYKRYTQKNLNDEALLTFGFGDGGGGPTPQDLEYARRASHGLPGSAGFKIGFAGEFLSRLASRLENRTDVPTWQGELYLEYHRGTYTTQANNKKNNRKSEFKYASAELLATLASALLCEKYPAKELHRGWEMILTNQFHDIIPGSSIRQVYEQSDKDYAEILRIGEGIENGVRERIAAGVSSERGYVVFNPHSFFTRGYVRVGGKTILTKEKIPPKGYLATNAFVSGNSVRVDGRAVETDRLSVRFDECMRIESVFDKKANREVLKSAAELRVYADFPDKYDAWEWQSYSRENFRAVTDVSGTETVDDGVRRGVRVVRRIGKSVITQTLWFYDGLCRIDFETEVDWHEKHKMLKAVFCADVNADKATYEIQFGRVERPTHMNTSWDAARFEVCAHKYADVSEGGYGVSLINDCKYGHDIHDGVISLSLLRSPTDPDPVADEGRHSFTYCLVPHEGTLAATDVPMQAYYLNYPMTAIPAAGSADALPASFSAVFVDKENVICETVKQAEDGDGTVVRMYESANIRTDLSVTFGIPAKKAYLCDLSENELSELPLEDGKIKLRVGGFEIVTVKVKA